MCIRVQIGKLSCVVGLSVRVNGDQQIRMLQQMLSIIPSLKNWNRKHSSCNVAKKHLWERFRLNQQKTIFRTDDKNYILMLADQARLNRIWQSNRRMYVEIDRLLEALKLYTKEARTLILLRLTSVVGSGKRKNGVWWRGKNPQLNLASPESALT